MRTSRWAFATVVLVALVVFGATSSWAVAVDHSVNVGNIHPWMAGNISVGVGSGPVPEILQGTDTQDMATPDRQGVIGIGEWCTTATYEYPGFNGVPNTTYPGVVHCGSAHLWLDSNQTITGASGALETAAASGVTDTVYCNGSRKVGGRFEGAT